METQEKPTETQERLRLIKRNLQEITDETILDKIVDKRPLRVYWGTATTGRPHIAYFVPLMKIRDFVQAGCHVKILLADIHAFLDSLKAPIEKIEYRVCYYEKLLKKILERLEVPLDRVEFVRGSSYQKSEKYVSDLLKMSSMTTIHDCIKAGTMVVKQSESPLLSSLLYPNMQALDEEYLGVDAQFGGVDQRKIFMHACKYMPKLKYKKRIYLMNPMMPGLSSEKMSSSDDMSKIDLLDGKKEIQKKISKCFCEPKNPNTGVLLIFKHIIYPLGFQAIEVNGLVYKTYDELEAAFVSGAVHPGDLKQACASLIDEIVRPIRETMLADMQLLNNAY